MSTSFGERLKQERNRLGHSQTDFAALGGVNKRSQINYENGRRSPNADYFQRIDAAGADVGFILAGRSVAQAPLSISDAFDVLEPLFALDGIRELNGPCGVRLAELIRPRNATDLSVRELLALLDQVREEERAYNATWLERQQAAAARLREPSA